MIKILTKADRNACPALFDVMYRARARHFHDRLGWTVKVRDGWEIDRYDEVEDPVYLMALDQAGRATGSLRILPTTGATMLKAEFADLFCRTRRHRESDGLGVHALLRSSVE